MTGSETPNSTVASSGAGSNPAAPRRSTTKFYLIILALLLWAASAILYFGKDAWRRRLAANYRDVVVFDCTLWNRVGLTDEWTVNPVTARQVDETLVAEPAPSKIQSTIHWTNRQGVVYYETTGIYGVDRKTGQNQANFGSRARHGQFVFPAPVEKAEYTIWDAYYIGPRQAKFSHTEKIGPIEAYVFQCWASDVDETDGFLYLDDVPEKYRVVSGGSGKVWIDPISGVILDFYDGGISSFVDAKTGKPDRPFLYWSSVYSEATKAEHLKLALEARRRISWFERWIPLGLFLFGTLLLVLRAVWISRVGRTS